MCCQSLWLKQGILTKREGSVQLTSSLMVDCFVKEVNNFFNIKKELIYIGYYKEVNPTEPSPFSKISLVEGFEYKISWLSCMLGLARLNQYSISDSGKSY